MSITLKNGAAALELDPDLLWSDEFAWSGVRQAVERGITGSLIVQSKAMTGGRPITLEPETDDSAWLTRENLLLLQAWSADPAADLLLTIRGVERAVLFRHEDDSGAITARPVVHFRDVLDSDQYVCTLRLMEK